jgi:small GTP-binding protein
MPTHQRTASQPHMSSMVKLVLAGDSGVGKTLIANRLAYPDVDPADVSTSTIGIDFFPVEAVTDDGLKVGVQVWDTAGQERYQALCTTTFRGAHAVLLVYDITNERSFDNLEKWRDSVLKHATNSVVAMVANKADLEHIRAVSTSRGQLLANSFGCAFIEVSAYSGDNLDRMLRMVVSAAVSNADGFGRRFALASTSAPSSPNAGLERKDSTSSARRAVLPVVSTPQDKPVRKRRGWCSAI